MSQEHITFDVSGATIKPLDKPVSQSVYVKFNEIDLSMFEIEYLLQVEHINELVEGVGVGVGGGAGVGGT